MNNLINSYLNYYFGRISEKELQNDLPEAVKRDLEIRVPIYRELIEVASFLSKSPTERQSVRVGWLGSMIKRDKYVIKKRAILELFDVINSFIPYLKVVNRNGVHNDFEMLLNRELDLIDFGYLNYENLHISEQEFKVEFEKFYKSTEDEILVSELRNKAEQLNNAFIKLYSID